jgi:acetyl esterase
MRTRLPVDPELRRLLDIQALLIQRPVGEMTNEERVQAARQMMLRALQGRKDIQGLPNGVTTRDVTIHPGLTARLYLPPTPTTVPTLVFLHGGGWVVGSVETHDPFCRLLSAAAGTAIVSVDYRLAPEHPYPAAVEDTLAAVHWTAAHLADWNGDPHRLGIGGDSAGGNLAAVAANHFAVTPGAPRLRGVVLLYPVTDHPSGNHPSYQENGRGFGLELAQMLWLWSQYAPAPNPDDTNLAPLRLEPVPSLPPVLVATAEYDVLRDEGIAYADKLRAAGVDVTHLHAPDMNHNFPVHPGTVARFPRCVETLGDVAGWVSRHL